MKNSFSIIFSASLLGILSTLLFQQLFYPKQFYTAALADGAVYDGDTTEGMLHGQGELIWPDSSKYQGEFVNGQFHGNGKLTAVIGIIYEGTFKKGNFTGEGSIQFSEDTVYSGEIKNGLMHGEGVYQTEKNFYRGKFKDDTFIKGIYDSANGEKYEGGFSDWTLHGDGTFLDKNGDSYIGTFKYGYLVGDGEHLTKNGELISSADGKTVITAESRNETTLYNQHDLLKATWQTLQNNNNDKIDLYFLGIAGDGTQAVFLREIQYIKNLFDNTFDTLGHSAVLINSRDTVDNIPLATVTSIKQTLHTISDKMDANEDILFIYMTSHGSKNADFIIKQKKLALPNLNALEFAQTIQSLPIKWKVIVISACYSGHFIEPLKDDNTLIITASAKDKVSFGCHDDNEFTFFGEAFFKQALSQTTDFVEAYDLARKAVTIKEKENEYEESSPQISKPKAIVAQLKKWKAQR